MIALVRAKWPCAVPRLRTELRRKWLCASKTERNNSEGGWKRSALANPPEAQQDLNSQREQLQIIMDQLSLMQRQQQQSVIVQPLLILLLSAVLVLLFPLLVKGALVVWSLCPKDVPSWAEVLLLIASTAAVMWGFLQFLVGLASQSFQLRTELGAQLVATKSELNTQLVATKSELNVQLVANNEKLVATKSELNAQLVATKSELNVQLVANNERLVGTNEKLVATNEKLDRLLERRIIF